MFDGWSKPKFYTKCKSALRHMRTRLEQVKKKRLAVEKFLKTDIADLLKGGLHYNAYLKADVLLVEQNITACYDLVELFCGCISAHLSDMVKQRECPEECREAAASLVYAAARFADMPELRQLRSLFTGRYGNSLEAFASKEFIEKFKANPSTKDMKLQLMQEIALESSIEWDSKALEQKLFTPHQASPVPKRDTPPVTAASKELKENRFKVHGKEENEAITEPRRGSETKQDKKPQTGSASGGSFVRPPYTRPNPSQPSVNVDEAKARSVRRRRSQEAAGDQEGKDKARHRATKSMSVAEEAESSGRSERKAHGRSSSLDLGGLVHPSLPDCDDLAARVAALQRIYKFQTTK